MGGAAGEDTKKGLETPDQINVINKKIRGGHFVHKVTFTLFVIESLP